MFDSKTDDDTEIKFSVLIILLIIPTAIIFPTIIYLNFERGAYIIGGVFSTFITLILVTSYIMAKKEKYEKKLRKSNKEIKRINQELEISNKKIKEADKLKSEFLANMSHELRTPLNAIIGFSEVLKSKSFGQLNSEQEDFVNDIHKAGKHLLKLINDVLDLSKIEAGKMELNFSEINIAKELESVHNVIRPLYQKKNLHFSIEIDEGISTIFADEIRFKQIMYNLLSNAIKFTKEGSVKVKVSKIDGSIQVDVIDTGIGIKKENLDLIFKEFYQSDSSLSKEYEGTGLGLSLTKKLVELHDGKIFVKSEINRGSTFSFTLPMKTYEPMGKEIIAVEIVPGRPTILLIEDSIEAIKLLKILLEQNGYSVAIAKNGLEGIQKAKELKPFAIVLDIMLPQKSGWDVLKKLKADEDTNHIPVIIVSIVEEKNIGFSLGALDYFVKPIDGKKLIERINSLEKAKEEKTILAIDDDPIVLKYLTNILENANFKVLKALSGKEGIEKAINKKPDIIILDLIMPDINGFDVIDFLKKDENTKDIPIIILTAKDLTNEELEKLNGNVQTIAKKEKFSSEQFIAELKMFEKVYRRG